MRSVRSFGLGTMLLLAGCERVFGVGAPADAYVEPARPLILTPTTDTDEDGIPNESDPCPLISRTEPGGEIDQDGDGIYDVCDPEPQMPGDCLALLDVFRDDVELSPRWRHDGQPLTLTNGTLELEDNSIAYLDVPLAVHSLAITGYIRGGTGENRMIQLFFDLALTPLASGTACAASQVSTAQISNAAVVQVEQGANTVVSEALVGGLPVGAGSSFEIDWNSSVAPGKCHVELAAQQNEFKGAADAPPRRSGTVAIRTSGDVYVSIDSVIGYGKNCVAP
ncbi:MAG: thrombospondin type 3 repeat-containing protein [Kofleriaceae bacterium]|nr:thrombospondin type 3 repeat-containing protein [Kofleriaceae bacterium]